MNLFMNNYANTKNAKHNFIDMFFCLVYFKIRLVLLKPIFTYFWGKVDVLWPGGESVRMKFTTELILEVLSLNVVFRLLQLKQFLLMFLNTNDIRLWFVGDIKKKSTFLKIVLLNNFFRCDYFFKSHLLFFGVILWYIVSYVVH